MIGLLIKLNEFTTESTGDAEGGFHYLLVEAKAQYDDYEKKHGNYIQTPNVKMHYLKWENLGGVPLIWSHGTGSSSYELMQIIDRRRALERE